MRTGVWPEKAAGWRGGQGARLASRGSLHRAGVASRTGWPPRQDPAAFKGDKA